MDGRGGRRVVVTGLGVVSPCGIGRDVFWAGLLAPAPGGERAVPDFDPSPWFDSPKDARRADRFTQFALAASAMALEQGGAPGYDPGRLGVLIATGVGGLSTIEEQVLVLHEKGPRRVSPFLVPMMMANAASASVSMRFGWQGPCETTVTACAASTHGIGNAARWIAWGRCDAALAGGSEASLTPIGRQGFINMTATSSSGVSRPFDVGRDGFLPAEGAAVLLLEELELARARGATILGEILGAANTADAHHITAPSPGGAGAVACMELALLDAGLRPGDIVQINAHGTSTPLNDASEAEAVVKVFGGSAPPISSVKGATGHLIGAAGAVEAIASILAIEHGMVFPTANHEELDPALGAIDVVSGAPRTVAPAPALSNSFGFGGHNASLVLVPGPAS
jgi:3-oxoacyl-[acyl-carrier-protein] synthase II